MISLIEKKLIGKFDVGTLIPSIKYEIPSNMDEASPVIWFFTVISIHLFSRKITALVYDSSQIFDQWLIQSLNLIMDINIVSIHVTFDCKKQIK